MSAVKYLMDAHTAAIKMERMALEIAEHLNDDNHPLVLFGIQNNGVIIARHIAQHLHSLRDQVSVETISLDKQQPASATISAEYDLSKCNIIVTDDVSNSG